MSLQYVLQQAVAFLNHALHTKPNFPVLVTVWRSQENNYQLYKTKKSDLDLCTDDTISPTSLLIRSGFSHNRAHVTHVAKGENKLICYQFNTFHLYNPFPNTIYSISSIN